MAEDFIKNLRLFNRAKRCIYGSAIHESQDLVSISSRKQIQNLNSDHLLNPHATRLDQGLGLIDEQIREAV